MLVVADEAARSSSEPDRQWGELCPLTGETHQCKVARVYGIVYVTFICRTYNKNRLI